MEIEDNISYVKRLENLYLQDKLSYYSDYDGNEVIGYRFPSGGAIEYVKGKNYINYHDNYQQLRRDIKEEWKGRLYRLFDKSKFKGPNYKEQSDILKDLLNEILKISKKSKDIEIINLGIKSQLIVDRIDGLIINPVGIHGKHGYGYYKTNEYRNAIGEVDKKSEMKPNYNRIDELMIEFVSANKVGRW